MTCFSKSTIISIHSSFIIKQDSAKTALSVSWTDYGNAFIPFILS